MKVVLVTTLLLFLIGVALSACGPAHRDYVYARANTMVHDDCVFYGFTPGTDNFAYCMMRRGAARPDQGFR